MEYTISVIADNMESSLIVDALKWAYHGAKAPAGSFTVQQIAEHSLVVFYRDSGEDTNVLDYFGEPLDQGSAMRQLGRELQLVAKSVGEDDENRWTPVKSVLSHLARTLGTEKGGVQGLDPAPEKTNVNVLVDVAGEGSRLYVAIMPGKQVQLLSGDDLHKAEGHLDKPCESIHFIGLVARRLSLS